MAGASRGECDHSHRLSAMQTYRIEAGTAVAANPAYEVVEAGDYGPHDLVPCRRIIDTNGPICAFLARHVLGLSAEESAA